MVHRDGTWRYTILLYNHAAKKKIKKKTRKKLKIYTTWHIKKVFLLRTSKTGP